MKNTLLIAAAAAMTLAMTRDDKTKKEIVGLNPKQVQWVYAFLLPGWAAAGRGCSAIPAAAALG